MLFALQIYFDLKKILRGSDDGDNYITINKPISLVNTFLGKSVFTKSNIQELENQTLSGIGKVGVFTPNRFKASASSHVVNFYTELFFESVPPAFLDVQDLDFRWQEGQGEIPIIMSKDYLALYNFGFALSQGLPQFTPATIRQVSIDVTVRGNGREQVFKGRIIGFSERINSILVPESFMQWSNANFGDQPDGGASRLILKVKNPYDKNLAVFLKEKGYELSSGKLIGGRLSTILNATLTVIAGIGIILMILSIIVFLLNYQLIISKSAADIKLLMQIGYHPFAISRILRGSLLRLLVVVFVAVVVALVAVRFALLSWFSNQGFDLDGSYHFLVIAAGLVLMGAITFLNFYNIKKSVLEQFLPRKNNL